MKKIIALVFAVCLFSASWAQQQTLYFMDAIPNSRYNPAAKPTFSWYMGTIPFLSGIEMRAQTPNFTLGNSSTKNNNTLTIDLNEVVDKLGSVNRAAVDLNVQALAFGFKTKDLFWDFSLGIKNEIQVAVPKALIELGLNGNGSDTFLGKTVDMSDLWVRGQSYMEFAFGVSSWEGERFRWGVRPKVLFGIMSTEAKFNTFDYTTNADTYATHISADALIRTNLPVETTTEENRVNDVESTDPDPDDYVMKNLGFGVDLGAYYQLNDDWEFDVAVTDIGFITWGTNTNLAQTNGEYTFEGAEYNGNDEDLENYGEKLGEELEEVFAFEPNSEKYTTSLTTKVFLGARYKVDETFKAGALFSSKFYQSKMHPALTLSANYQPFHEIDLTATYGIANGSYANIGLGTAFNLGAFQLYAVTDNLLAAFSPEKSNNLSFQFGFNLIFGHKKPKKTADYPLVEPLQPNDDDLAPE